MRQYSISSLIPNYLWNPHFQVTPTLLNSTAIRQLDPDDRKCLFPDENFVTRKSPCFLKAAIFETGTRECQKKRNPMFSKYSQSGCLQECRMQTQIPQLVGSQLGKWDDGNNIRNKTCVPWQFADVMKDWKTCKYVILGRPPFKNCLTNLWTLLSRCHISSAIDWKMLYSLHFGLTLDSNTEWSIPPQQNKMRFHDHVPVKAEI